MRLVMNLILVGLLATTVACGGTRSSQGDTSSASAQPSSATAGADVFAIDRDVQAGDEPMDVAGFVAHVKQTAGLQGEVVRSYDDGSKELVAHYDDGLRHGSYTSYHANGQIFEQGSYVHGRKDGEWVSFYPSGQKLDEGSFDEGRPIGVHRAWLEDGTLIVEKNHGI